jgi:hypothetical protein
MVSKEPLKCSQQTLTGPISGPYTHAVLFANLGSSGQVCDESSLSVAIWVYYGPRDYATVVLLGENHTENWGSDLDRRNVLHWAKTWPSLFLPTVKLFIHVIKDGICCAMVYRNNTSLINISKRRSNWVKTWSCEKEEQNPSSFRIRKYNIATKSHHGSKSPCVCVTVESSFRHHIL